MLVDSVVFEGALVSDYTAKTVSSDILLATTLDGVANASVEIASRLSRLGIASACDVGLELNKSERLVVRMKLKQPSTISAKIGSSISSQSADISGSLSIRNLAGH